MKIDKFNDSHTHISMDVSLRDDIQSFQWAMEASNTTRINFLALNAHTFFQETQLDNSKCLFLKSAFAPNGYAGYCMDYSKEVSSKGFLDQIELAYNAGFDCWKIIESKPNSQKVWGHRVDEPLYDLAFAFAEEKKLPIIVHVADPIQEWSDSYKEGYLQKEEYRQQIFNVLERHPNLILTFAHVGFMGDNPELVESLFKKYKTVYLDTVPAPEEFFVISKYHNEWKKIFNNYSDRILFGTDRGNHSVLGYTKEQWLKEFPPINEYITRILRKDGPCDGRFPFPGLEEHWGTEFYGLNIDDDAYNNIVYNNFIKIYGNPRKINFELLHKIADYEFSLPSKSPYKEEDYKLIVNTCINSSTKRRKMPNSRGDYSEEIIKDTDFRKNYYDGILKLLYSEKENADKKRRKYISPESLKTNPEKYRSDLRKMLGYPLTTETILPKVKEKFFVATDKNVNIYRMVFCFWDKVDFYGLYFEQIENKDNLPFVVCFHGGKGTPELVSGIHMDSANYNHLVRRITDRNVNVFAPQLLLWDTEKYGNPINRDETDGKLKQLGGSITALELYFTIGAINRFVIDEKINENQIGVAGMSYGGMYALFLAAVDTRIKACYSCSWVCDCFEYSWEDWSYQNAQYQFTTAEVAALVCPRALFVAMGNEDNLFDFKLTEKTCDKIEKFYRTFNANNNFAMKVFDGVHEIDKDDLEIDFLIEKLKEK